MNENHSLRSVVSFSFAFVKKKKKKEKCRLNYIGAGTGKRKTDEKEKAARGVGAAATAIAVAGTVLRPRERVNFHEHGGNEEQPEGRGVEPRLWRQAQRYYTRAYQHLPWCDALLHRSGRVYSAQVRRLVLCGYVLKQISIFDPRSYSIRDEEIFLVSPP